ncbi:MULTISPECIES: acyl-CoA dehydrogenase family protein [Streptomyces]|uniref:Acyl-CoA dehydrogenase n=1 Tax=Streptomyces dengpaensis TaxID=2049881 RepID=A0ABN5I7Y7_9ACTN|nr:MULTISPECIES: acyl-CoA dehydrogenase family protein [Streptomyces]AVH59294.1 acyl-CoA dehydrogenase [Streptomyces dengpaensis]PIB08791.1 acyl-CoA dehydrogenase [Streptomyces sp. HG99]
MRFLLDTEQRAFAASLDAMLTSADTPSVVRAWATGDHAPGRALWSRLAGAGVFALAVPGAYDGVGPLPVELAVAFVELGRHGVPGPLVETVAAAALLSGLDESGPAKRLLPSLASGETMATVALPGGGTYVLDGDVADVHLTVRAATSATAGLHLTPTPVGASSAPRASLDPARRLVLPHSGGELLAAGPHVARAAAHALIWARLATAAQALGVGLALLDRTVGYVKQRRQFGVPVGSFQAVKHRLADALIGLEFARPLLFGAALSMAPAHVAAAKVAACEAAYVAARTALQLHGAVGYTDEYDLSLWLTKARALRAAWGTPAACRAEVLCG